VPFVHPDTNVRRAAPPPAHAHPPVARTTFASGLMGAHNTCAAPFAPPAHEPVAASRAQSPLDLCLLGSVGPMVSELRRYAPDAAGVVPAQCGSTAPDVMAPLDLSPSRRVDSPIPSFLSNPWRAKVPPTPHDSRPVARVVPLDSAARMVPLDDDSIPVFVMEYLDRPASATPTSSPVHDASGAVAPAAGIPGTAGLTAVQRAAWHWYRARSDLRAPELANGQPARTRRQFAAAQLVSDRTLERYVTLHGTLTRTGRGIFAKQGLIEAQAPLTPTAAASIPAMAPARPRTSRPGIEAYPFASMGQRTVARR
jgi:hypothetical protein